MTDMPCEAIQTNHCGSSLPELGHLASLSPTAVRIMADGKHLCTRMRLLVTVDNYNHTHEHLFEFGVQHAEIANFTIQRLRNPAVSDGGHGRRVMIVAPTLGVRNLHLVAEHIPDHAWLLPRVQRLDHGHIRQFGHPLITRQRTTVGPTEHLFK